MKQTKTALALFSGGCDSMISMKLLVDQGIKVYALNFNIGFGSNYDKSEYFKNAAKQVGAELLQVDIREQFFNEILFKPKYGYGKYFNPCIDCHANMFAHAFYKLVELDADFVVSGEVLGQRPKSQRKEALDQVKKLVREIGQKPEFKALLESRGKLDSSGLDSNKPQFLDELLLRPMSAKLMEPSFPEKKGWVDREKLLDIQGRSRTRQLAMVKEFGWKYFENPGGGCLLTDLSVATKLKDLSAHRTMNQADSTLVKVGRYMVLPNGTRLIVGRNENENLKLKTPNENTELIELLENIGPIAVIDKNANNEDKILAASITLGYGKVESSLDSRKVKIGEDIIEVSPYPKEKAKEFLLFKE